MISNISKCDKHTNWNDLLALMFQSIHSCVNDTHSVLGRSERCYPGLDFPQHAEYAPGCCSFLCRQTSSKTPQSAGERSSFGMMACPQPDCPRMSSVVLQRFLYHCCLWLSVSVVFSCCQLAQDICSLMWSDDRNYWLALWSDIDFASLKWRRILMENMLFMSSFGQ